jgi:hypothetical protein
VWTRREWLVSIGAALELHMTSDDLVFVDQAQRRGDRLRAQRLQRLVRGPDDVLNESGLAVSDVDAVPI